ncbi:DUF2852 domain-containing protein [Granulosicoccus sp. 3-233]|uniref:DUF2852 domain-containing protein n=1 Tax=Granulosicoccus sp. 3-233 TaxID=3417969 RepID=UPI003D344A23
MCSSRRSTVESRSHRSWSRSADEAGRSGRWTGVNIVAMVAGFVLFWPVGLVILFWIYSGRDVQDLPGAVREQWGRLFNGSKSVQGESDNVVFNDYQQTQYDRIREIKEEIKSRAQRFSDFRMDARRRADQEEFDRFMASGSKAGASEQ